MVELTYPKPNISDAEYEEFCRKFYNRPPDSVRDQYLRINGGIPSEADAEADLWGFPIGGVNSIKYGSLPIEVLIRDIGDISPKNSAFGSWSAGWYLPFATDYGSNTIFVSLRNSDYDKVYLYASDGENVFQLADSFADFINVLYKR